jgi:hypothetical protein
VGKDARDMRAIATEKTEFYKKVVDLANQATVIYIGWATEGTATSTAEWRIKRISIASDVYTIEWADGNYSFDNEWDNRATLSYS